MAVIKFERKPGTPPPGQFRPSSPPPGFALSKNFVPLLALLLVSGIMLYSGMIGSRPLVFAFVVAGWVISLCLHEFGHALAAYYGGDRSVEAKGYLTLDPFAYSHWVNSILFPVIILALGGLGLPGGAVYINHDALRSKAWDSFVAAAGPLGTLFCLLVLAVPLWLGLDETYGKPDFWAAWHMLAYIEVSALVLNLLPIPGFDGFNIIRPWLPPQMQRQAQAIAQISFFIFFALLMAMPSVNYALFNMIYIASQPFGIGFAEVIDGLKLFRFWNW